MMATLGAARKQRIDALGHAGDEGVSLASDAWRRLRVSPLFWVGAVIVGLFLVLAVVRARVIAPSDPGAQLLSRQTSASPATPSPRRSRVSRCGGDTQGRDLFPG